MVLEPSQYGLIFLQGKVWKKELTLQKAHKSFVIAGAKETLHSADTRKILNGVIIIEVSIRRDEVAVITHTIHS